MTALNLTTLPIGVYLRGLGIITPDNLSITQRFATGLDGRFNKRWTWNAYVQYGENRGKDRSLNNIILSKFYEAVDAVRNPATGGIVCRSTLTNPNNGCVPLNILGEHSPTKEAAAYVHGDMYNKLTVSQLVAEASVSGEVFTLPAGPVDVTAGAGYRKEKAKGVGDPISNAPNPITGLPGGYFLTNRRALSGQFDLGEVFGEAVAPILRDAPLAKALDLNAAARYTKYSTSGSVVTWKLGITWDVNEELRFRATRSRDIRAANIGELFAAPGQGRNSITDPVLGGISYNIQPTSSGNPDLEPEKADTTALGVVYRPNWLAGLSLSVDGYDIDIKDAIGSLSPQEIVDQCAGGATIACALVIRDPVTQRILDVRTVQLNLAARRVTGIDFEAGYRHGLGNGQLSLRGLMNYVAEFSTTSPSGVKVDRAGDVGTPTGVTPRWRGYFTATYNQGPLTLLVQEKFVGKGKYNVLWTSAQLADEFNNIGSRWYTSVTAKYKLESVAGSPEVFATVNNLFDRAPPINPNNSISSLNTNLDLYDGVGRAYVVGLRARF
jgi:outer membrane receptor protein involved in Fe transport